MPIGDLDVRLKEDLLREGMDEQRRRWEAAGTSEGEQWARVLTMYPNARRLSWLAVIDHVNAARDLGKQVPSLKDDEKLDRKDFPVNPAIPQAYRYTVAISWTHSKTGTRITRTLVIDSPTNLTKAQIHQRGLEAMIWWMEEFKKNHADYEATAEVITARRYRVTGAVRRT